jgi:DNA helicase-2/ATP-dependent DNA helicase PcrA
MDEFLQSETGYSLRVDSAFTQVKAAVRILSNSNAQTLGAVADRVRTLLEHGSDPSCIRVLLPNDESCLRFRAVAEAMLGGEGGSLDVLTPRGLALSVLDDPRAQQSVGRRFPDGHVRVALPYEMDFIFEDLKTLGIPPKRLREMVKFLYRGLSELADESVDWLVAEQERIVVDFLNNELSYLQCAIEPELSNLATKALRRNEAVRRSFARDHVIAGAYQDFSRASQLLCHLAATESIFVVASEKGSVATGDSFPYQEGVDEFLRINPRAHSIAAESPGRAMRIEERDWKSMDDEVRSIPSVVGSLIDEGNDPERIALVCFHTQWRRNVGRALEAAGVPVKPYHGPFLATRDVRSLDRSLSLHLVAALRLLSNPHDSLAIRTIRGFGDYLAGSDEFVPERLSAQKACADAVLSFASFPELRALMPCASLTGRALLEALCVRFSEHRSREIPNDLAPLLVLGESATASDMVAAVDRSYGYALSSKRLPNERGVTLCAPEDLAGLEFDVVVLVGFVNGLFPEHGYFDPASKSLRQRTHMHESDTAKIDLIKSAAASKVVVSSFSMADLALADAFRLKVDRIRLCGGKRIACVSKSVFARELA